jgi:hypothetical protein
MYVAVPKRFNAAGQKNAPTVERERGNTSLCGTLLGVAGGER